jgi:hypothetical protein
MSGKKKLTPFGAVLWTMSTRYLNQGRSCILENNLSSSTLPGGDIIRGNKYKKGTRKGENVTEKNDLS